MSLPQRKSDLTDTEIERAQALKELWDLRLQEAKYTGGVSVDDAFDRFEANLRDRLDLAE